MSLYGETLASCECENLTLVAYDAALAMALGHVVLREFHLDRQADYFEDYCRRYTDMPMLVRLVRKNGHYIPERLLRASDFKDGLGNKISMPYRR